MSWSTSIIHPSSVNEWEQRAHHERQWVTCCVVSCASLPAPCDSLHRQATDDPGSDIPIGADLQEPVAAIMISIFDEYFWLSTWLCFVRSVFAITLYMMDHVMCMYDCKRWHITKVHCFMSSLVERLRTASFSSAVLQICVEDSAKVHHWWGSAGGDPLLLPPTLTQNHLLQSFDLDVRDVSRLWDLERRGGRQIRAQTNRAIHSSRRSFSPAMAAPMKWLRDGRPSESRSKYRF